MLRRRRLRARSAADYLDKPGALSLENALAEMEELSELLLRMGEGDPVDRCLVYLGHRLQDHHAEAYVAFCQIFGLDDYNPKAEGARS
jgi:hypothetical protein